MNDGAWLDLEAVGANASFADQPLELRARQIRDDRRQEVIEAQPLVFGFGTQDSDVVFQGACR